MRSVLRLVAASCAFASVQGKWIKRNDESEPWEPARETDGVMNMDPAGWTPKPTQAPGARPIEMELFKRAGTSTCGYYAGYSSSAAVICQASAQCIVNEGHQAVGCCRSADIQSCLVPTKCYPSRSAALYSDFNLDYTILCTSAAYPNCVTYSYDQYDPLYAGYSAVGCGVESGVYSVEYYAPVLGSAATSSQRTSTTARTTTSTSTRTTTTRSSSSESTTRTGTSSTSSSGSLGADQTSLSTPGSTQSSGSSTGAIVGGVVGGVGGLALIVLGIFFLVRYLKDKKQEQGAPAAVPAQSNVYYAPGPGQSPPVFGQSPQMAQPQQQFTGYPPGGFAGPGNQAGMAPSAYYAQQSPKPSQYESVTTAPVSSTGGSPVTAYTPPPANSQQAPYQAYQPPPNQQYQAYRP